MKSPRYVPVLAVFLVLLAFGLRLYLLGDANLWWDEAYSVWLARRPIPELMRITAYDVHPPLYYILLHVWIRLAGQSEFAVRYLSLIAGVVTVGVTYRLGADLIGRQAALFGVLLLAVSRFHIWWSQEVRMYIWAALWATLATWLFYRLAASRRGGAGVWLLSVAGGLATLAALFTLYLSGLLLVTFVTAAGILLVTRRLRWHKTAAWMAGLAGVGLFYLPWVLYAGDKIRGAESGAAFAPEATFAVYSLLLAAGISTDIGQYLPLAVFFGAILAAGALSLAINRCALAAAFLIPPLVVPPLVIFSLTVIDWQFYQPAPEARYFLLFAPLCLLIPATLIAPRPGHRYPIADWRLILAAALLAIAAWSTPQRYADRILRDEWKTAADILRAYARPGDTVVIVSGNRWPLFLYEYEQIATDRPRAVGVPDNADELTPENVNGQMREAVRGAERVWLVAIEEAIQDPEGQARRWLEGRYTPVMWSPVGYNSLTLYTQDGRLPALSASPPPTDIFLPVHRYRPGDTIQLGLYTREPASIAMQYQSGLVYAEAGAEGSEALHRYDLRFPVTQATPAGRYDLLDGTGKQVGQIHIEGSDPLYTEADVPRRLDALLAGGAIGLLGYAIQPQVPAPGEAVTLDLFWRRTDTAPLTDSTIFTQIVGPPNPATGSPVWAQHDGPPVAGTFPLSLWPPGLIIRDRHILTFDPAAPGGVYTLIAGMYDPLSGSRLAVSGQPEGYIILLTFQR